MSNLNRLEIHTFDAMGAFEEVLRKTAKVLLVMYVIAQIICASACYYLLEELTRGVRFNETWPFLSMVIYMNLLPIIMLVLSITSQFSARYINLKKFAILAASEKSKE